MAFDPKRKKERISSVSIHGSKKIEVIHAMEEVRHGHHCLSPQQLEKLFSTDLKDGLTDSKAEELLVLHGPNKLKDLRGTSVWSVVRHNFFGWFQCVLWAGALLNFIAYATADLIDSDHGGGHSKNEYLYLGIVITATIVGTGLFGLYVELQNVATMSGFENLIPPDSTVVRDGVVKNIPNSDLVPGDIVEMKAGETVPADVVILSCSNFSTDMSSMTGESKPILHCPEFTHVNPLESKNMAFFTSPIVQGSARALVVHTGEATQIGKIAGLVTGLEKVETPISKEITRFIKLICVVAFGFGIIFFIMVYMAQGSWLSALQYMLGIILANVPEGLIVTLTVCMTLSAKQLKKKNCLAKTLQAVETLGSTSCICSDKTGTLTENRMSVSHLFCNFVIYDKSDHTQVSDPIYSELCFDASLNLKAQFSYDTITLPIAKRKILGDASEAAILRYMEDTRSATKTQKENPMVADIPFSSVWKYQVTIHRLNETPGNPPAHYFILIMKGAPEIILERCSELATPDGNVPLTPQLKRDLKNSFIKLANMGERVIGYGDIKLPKSEYTDNYKFDTEQNNFPLENLTFVGAISMIDPPREDIDLYISICRGAGIRVVMVTGDHPVTALAISRQVGIITEPTAYDYAFDHHIDVADVPQHVRKQFVAAVITGDDLRRMGDTDLVASISKYKEITFARTSPQQKLMIVEAFQSLKYCVAVTGDGVNDSPALKKADIGVAMGITGTEVSKKAADMILLDDNFASIVLGVQEGRRIFDNLKKTIAYTLTSNTPEMLPFVLYATLGIPLPLTLMLILVINVGTDLLPAISLAYETSEEDIMHHPPRKLSDHLVNKYLLYMAYFQIGLIQFFAGMFCYFIVFAEHGFFPSTLFFIRNKWESKNAEVDDTIGRTWFFDERKAVERRAQTAYFVAVCWSQIADVIICKTRRISLIKKGMWNQVLNASIVIDFLAALIVTYVPPCNKVFGTEYIPVHDFFLSLPFCLLMILGDEFRRYLIRNNLSDWASTELYY